MDKALLDCREGKDGPTGLYTTIGTVFWEYNPAWPCKAWVYECDSCGKGCETCSWRWENDGWNKYESANMGGDWTVGTYRSAGSCTYDCDVTDSCSTCEDTCYGQSCEFWGQYGYTCSVLENTYGCACDGCSC